MITIAIIRQIEADGVADLEVDKDLFYEELPLQHNGAPAEGVWAVTRGGSASNTAKGYNLHTTIDFYVALQNKAQADATLAKIGEWLRNNRTICALSGSVGGNSYSFKNVRILPTTTPLNNGRTDNGNIVKTASADVIYDIDNNN